MTAPEPNLTARVCERIVASGREPLDARLLPAARQLFLDGVAVAVAGARLESAPRILAEHFADPLTGTGGGLRRFAVGPERAAGDGPGGTGQWRVNACARLRADVAAGDACAFPCPRGGAGAG